MKKRGAISLSFGFIFSVILIAVIIAVAFYAINYFINFGKCTEISLFYDEFQKKIDKAWGSEITKDIFVSGLPRGIRAVCFYNEGSRGTGEEYAALQDYFRTKANMFLYPPEKACEQESRKMQHADLSELGWYCFKNEDGRISIPIEKGSFDALVKIKRIN